MGGGLWLALLASLLLPTTLATNATDKDERARKALSVFTVVKFPNTVCDSTTTGRNGTCYTSSECSAKGSVAVEPLSLIFFLEFLGAYLYGLPGALSAAPVPAPLESAVFSRCGWHHHIALLPGDLRVRGPRREQHLLHLLRHCQGLPLPAEGLQVPDKRVSAQARF